MSWPKDAFLYLRQIATPKGRPQPGGNLLYAKSDNELYLLDDDGTEHQVGGTETLPVSIIDAKGDLIVGSAADTAARLAVGSDGNTLAAYAAATNGVKYVTSSVPIILLPNGSTAANVPAGTPIGTIVLVKA